MKKIITNYFAGAGLIILFFNSAINIQDLTTGEQLCSLIKIDKLIPFKKEFINNYVTLLKEYNNMIKQDKITKNEYY